MYTSWGKGWNGHPLVFASLAGHRLPCEGLENENLALLMTLWIEISGVSNVPMRDADNLSSPIKSAIVKTSCYRESWSGSVLCRFLRSCIYVMIKAISYMLLLEFVQAPHHPIVEKYSDSKEKYGDKK